MAESSLSPKRKQSSDRTDLRKKLGKLYRSASDLKSFKADAALRLQSETENNIDLLKPDVKTYQTPLNIKRSHSFQNIRQPPVPLPVPPRSSRPVPSSVCPPTADSTRPPPSLTVYYMGRPMSAKAAPGYSQRTAEPIGFAAHHPADFGLVGQRWYPTQLEAGLTHRLPYPWQNFSDEYVMMNHRQSRDVKARVAQPISLGHTTDEKTSNGYDRKPTNIRRSASARAGFAPGPQKVQATSQSSNNKPYVEFPSVDWQLTSKLTTQPLCRSKSTVGSTNGTKAYSHGPTKNLRTMQSDWSPSRSIVPMRDNSSNTNRAEFLLPSQKIKTSDSIKHRYDVQDERKTLTQNYLEKQMAESLRRQLLDTMEGHKRAELSTTTVKPMKAVRTAEKFHSNITLTIRPPLPHSAMPKQQASSVDLPQPSSTERGDEVSSNLNPESMTDRTNIAERERSASPSSAENISSSNQQEKLQKPFKKQETSLIPESREPLYSSLNEPINFSIPPASETPDLLPASKLNRSESAKASITSLYVPKITPARTYFKPPIIVEPTTQVQTARQSHRTEVTRESENELGYQAHDFTRSVNDLQLSETNMRIHDLDQWLNRRRADEQTSEEALKQKDRRTGSRSPSEAEEEEAMEAKEDISEEPLPKETLPVPRPINLSKTDEDILSSRNPKLPLKSILKLSSSLNRLNDVPKKRNYSPLAVTQAPWRSFRGIRRSQSARALLDQSSYQIKPTSREKRVGFDIGSNSVLEFLPNDSSDESASPESEYEC